MARQNRADDGQTVKEIHTASFVNNVPCENKCIYTFKKQNQKILVNTPKRRYLTGIFP